VRLAYGTQTADRSNHLAVVRVCVYCDRKTFRILRSQLVHYFVILPRQRTGHIILQFYVSAFVVTKKLAARFASRACDVRYGTQTADCSYHLAASCVFVYCYQEACRATRLQLVRLALSHPGSGPIVSSYISFVPAFVTTKKLAVHFASSSCSFSLSQQDSRPIVSPGSFVYPHLL